MDIKQLNEELSTILKEAEELDTAVEPIEPVEPSAEEMKFLTHMQKAIQNEEGISWGEIAKLEALQPQVVWLGDMILAQWAGIDEDVWFASDCK